MGKFEISLDFADGEFELLHCETRLTPGHDIKVIALPRDVYVLDHQFAPTTKGAVYVEQSGPTAGLVWFSVTQPARATILYFQNLTALSDYCEDACVDPCGAVGADWPEIGLALPSGEKPLSKGKEYVLSDAFLSLSSTAATSEVDAAEWFLSHLANIYGRIPKPETKTYDWTKAATRALRVLSQSKDCGRRCRGRRYLNAYIGSMEKPPESMVQLAVLVPLLEYENWSRRPTKLSRQLLSAMPTFFNEKLKAMARWLPGQEFGDGAGSEEERHDHMDSWYYLHTLLNVARLAAMRHDGMMDLLLPSLDHAIKVAHHFNYEWPVFYTTATFAVVKAETKPGEGGEHDVAGLYAHVMLQAYELTKDEKYLQEAESAARHLQGKSFRLLYQTNNTMMTALALIKLWRLTDKRLYRDLSSICMANVVARFWIWNANFGFGKAYDTFMGVAPLQDAPYLAAYEEHEFLASAISYIKEAGSEIQPALNLLLSEYMKYLLHRARFYFCEELPPEAICDEPKEGHIRPELFVPLEDVYGGWKQAGQVGQEVYGSAAPFILTTSAYINKAELPFLIRTEYPVLQLDFEKTADGGTASLRVAGDPAYRFQLQVLPKKARALKWAIRLIEIRDDGDAFVKSSRRANSHEFMAKGGGHYRLEWALAKPRRASKPR